MNNDTIAATKPARDWSTPVIFGASIGLAIAVSRTLHANLEPDWGYWPTLAASLLAAGATGGLIALIGGLVWRKFPSKSAS